MTFAFARSSIRPRLWCALGACAIASTSIAGTATPSSARSAPLPPLAFRSSPAWVTITTGPTDPSLVAPQVWAITRRGNTSALRPFDLFNGLRGLSRDAIVVWATTAGRGGATHVFSRAHWPLRLASFRVDRTWEGQPAPSVEQRLRWAWVRGWRLDVRVYFAQQEPGLTLLRAAQEELDRLLLPRIR